MINSVLGKLRSKSGRNALSLLLYYVLILHITPHLSEVQNFQLDCVEVDLHEKNTCSSYYQRLVMSLIRRRKPWQSFRLPNDNRANSVRETKLTVSLRTRH